MVVVRHTSLDRQSGDGWRIGGVREGGEVYLLCGCQVEGEREGDDTASSSVSASDPLEQ